VTVSLIPAVGVAPVLGQKDFKVVNK